ncbi:hypothetical protein ACIQ9J_01780 [Streptomyces sp. NPDC094153]|uniref:hypothetical protein n=1 Tax=Streptomyces sp. NPDC094153 TaxID=3366058 RepID=UPI003806F23D
MSHFEAALAGAVTVVGVSAVLVSRGWPSPTGRHRAPAVKREPASAPQAVPAPALVPGAIVVQVFDDCPTCGRATAGMLHRTGWTCGTCLTSVIAGGTP